MLFILFYNNIKLLNSDRDIVFSNGWLGIWLYGFLVGLFIEWWVAGFLIPGNIAISLP